MCRDIVCIGIAFPADNDNYVCIAFKKRVYISYIVSTIIAQACVHIWAVLTVVILISENLVLVANFPLRDKLTFTTQAIGPNWSVIAIVCFGGNNGTDLQPILLFTVY